MHEPLSSLLHSQAKFKEEKIAGSGTVLLSCEGIGLKGLERSV